MASIMNRANQMTSTTSDCTPVCCPDCGGLECLCRPRFFSGQLLTDEDLTRLDHYITAKNKLHNRNLIGWGVVCGLDVVCNECDGMVTVKPGYALSPCGDDIVVCADAPVDICSMIQKCTRKQPRDCQPAQPDGVDPCSNTTEQWILKIHYDEKNSRGIVPLKNTGSAACCSKCACGGSGSCGCQSSSSSSSCCGGKGSSSNGNGGKSGGCGCGSTSASTSTSAQAQCQPTIVCETYYFEICKVQNRLDTKTPVGALAQRFLNCLTALQGLVYDPPEGDDQQAILNWCCDIRNNLLDFFADNPGYSCSIPSKLALMCQSGADVQTIKTQVAFLLAQYIKDCFCAALLPPCPCPVEDASVPLAAITVSKANGVCRIVSICNLEVRKFATTFPNLAYWLSVFPFASDIKKALAGVCCKPLFQRQTQFGDQNQVNHFAMGQTLRETDAPAAKVTAEKVASKAKASATATAGPAVGAGGKTSGNVGTSGVGAAPGFQRTHELSEVTFSAFAQPNRTVDVQTLAYAALGLSDDQNQPFLSPVEMSHPMETLMMNQFARPFVAAVLPPGLNRIVSGLAGKAAGADATGAAAPAAAAQPDIVAQLADLKSQMNAMREDLKNSQDQIDTLKKKKK